MIRKINAKSLLELVEEELNTYGCEFCHKEDLRSWVNISPEINENIELVAEFYDSNESIKKNGYNEYHPGGTSYWSADAPIAVNYYPYHESRINICKKCNAVFLTYTEYAGHGPQHRIRYVNKDLVVE
ncbi:hypothetical protein ACJJID_12735 [Microbulbifer sp. CnH-101-G]|uniref:hypothetical protein n=1 Tax=Microbulbifer sp. CnH-101-G TaxID=3243393 RepID=UPI00403A061A